MTRQWRKEKQSDFAKPSFSFDQCTLLNPDFSYTLPRRSAPVWGSHVFFNLKPQITRGHIYIRQYTITLITKVTLRIGSISSWSWRIDVEGARTIIQ